MDATRDRRWSRALLLLLVGAAIAGCATTALPPPWTMKPGDFKMLAGEWTGTSYVDQEVAQALIGVIYEPGSFFVALRAQSGVQVPGLMQIVNGEVIYDAQTSRGKMTFHEAPGEWIWKWDGQTKVGGRAVKHELRRAR